MKRMPRVLVASGGSLVLALSCHKGLDTGCLYGSDPCAVPLIQARVVVTRENGSAVPNATAVITVTDPDNQAQKYSVLQGTTDANGQWRTGGTTTREGWHGLAILVTPLASSGLKPVHVSDSGYFWAGGSSSSWPGYPDDQVYRLTVRP